MARIRAIIERNSDADYVTFMDDLGTQNLGRRCRFTSDHQVFEMLRRAGASLELHNVVENALRTERKCVVVLTLTEEQYAKLKHQKPRQ